MVLLAWPLAATTTPREGRKQPLLPQQLPHVLPSLHSGEGGRTCRQEWFGGNNNYCAVNITITTKPSFWLL